MTRSHLYLVATVALEKGPSLRVGKEWKVKGDRGGDPESLRARKGKL